MRELNLALRFVLEVAALVALGYWGWKVGPTDTSRWLLGAGVPLLVAVVWALLGAPSAPWRLGPSRRLVLEIAIHVAAVTALFAAGQPAWGLVLAALVALNLGLMQVWGQR